MRCQVEEAVKHFKESVQLFKWLHSQAEKAALTQTPYPFSAEGLLKMAEFVEVLQASSAHAGVAGYSVTCLSIRFAPLQSRVTISGDHLANERRIQRQREHEQQERQLALQRQVEATAAERKR